MKRSSITTAQAKGGARNGVTPAAPAPPAAPPPAAVKPQPRPWTVRRVLLGVASLRLTVVLLALSLVLVFCGTLAQIDAGIWSVVNKYFWSWYVWVPFQLFVKFGQIFFSLPSSWSVPGAFPFPGGKVLGLLLLVNLLAAHLVRFKVSWKRSGILTIHAGLILLLLGECVTREFALEGNMSIEQKLATNYVEHKNKAEIAVVDTSDPKEDVEVVIPESLLRKGGTIQNPALPFDVVVERFFVNSALARADDDKVEIQELRENSGASADSGHDIPSAYVTLKKKGSDVVLGRYLLSAWLTDWMGMRFVEQDDTDDEGNVLKKRVVDVRNKPPHTVAVDDKTYDISLRWKRSYKPYTIRLYEFKHDRYIGTNKPKNFSSKIELENPSQNDHRETLIYMNSPMRYRGETFYQAGVLGNDQGTILQVVRNPGWLLPYFSCTLVGVGMLVHFGMHLVTFLRRRAVL